MSRSGKRLTTEHKQRLRDERTRQRLRAKRKLAQYSVLKPRYTNPEYAEIKFIIERFIKSYYKIINPRSVYEKSYRYDQLRLPFCDFICLVKKLKEGISAIQFIDIKFHDDIASIQISVHIPYKAHGWFANSSAWPLFFKESFSDPKFFEKLLIKIDVANIIYWMSDCSSIADISIANRPLMDYIRFQMSEEFKAGNDYFKIGCDKMPEDVEVDLQNATMCCNNRKIRFKDGVILTDDIPIVTINKLMGLCSATTPDGEDLE